MKTHETGSARRAAECHRASSPADAPGGNRSLVGSRPPASMPGSDGALGTIEDYSEIPERRVPEPDASRLADIRAQLWPAGSCPTPLAVAVWRRSAVAHGKMPLDLGPPLGTCGRQQPVPAEGLYKTGTTSGNTRRPASPSPPGPRGERHGEQLGSWAHAGQCQWTRKRSERLSFGRDACVATCRVYAASLGCTLASRQG